MRSSFVRPIVALAVTALSACAGEPTATTTTPAVTAPRAAIAAERFSPARIPNSLRYRELGARPAVGRSGSAALVSRALLGADGVVRLDVHSAAAATPSQVAGTLAKVQVKRFGPRGEVLSTSNGKPGTAAETYALGGMRRLDRVQVQANVRGVDGARTDVITIVDTVRRRPDLTVASIELPTEVVAGIPVNIAATVREANGDVGATADCVLLVDGAEADRASGIWVDAGDVVTCAFTHRFDDAGAHAVSVRTMNADPYDDVPANDAASTSVTAVRVVSDAFAYLALASDYVATRDWTQSQSNTSLTDGTRYDWTMTGHDSVRIQTAYFEGRLARAVTFPLERVELRQSAGGSVLHEATLAARAADVVTPAGVSCATDLFGAGYSSTICSDPAAGLTTIVYRRDAGATTYQSSYYAQVWLPGAGTEPSHVVNVPFASGSNLSVAPLPSMGDRYTFDIALRQGFVSYEKQLTLALTSFGPRVSGVPYGCDSPAVSGNQLVQNCLGSRTVESGTTSDWQVGAPTP